MRQKESRYVNDYLRTYAPNLLQWKRVRLGPLPDKEMARIYSVALRWADAIYVKDNEVHIVEAKLRNQIAGISQLELYVRLFPETPEFSAFYNYKIVPELVVPYLDNEVKRMCEEKGIKYIIFTPSWYSRF